ncbi:hypothetical protein [Hyalangium rubrum]|uniref:Uncharacterized protein n=1 Tax=Hyalangium rubrum TaxID=3103134 RepID=A0ABU5GYF2_9BACT|nr:hypothetical protein [Hyalangium sp. s54d21]MDY7226219.1 hypothetical protein [Hyalangium sp. s54d21]
MFVLILACAGALAGLLMRTGPRIERVVREANDFEGALHPRPPHIGTPTTGTFARAVEPLLAEARELPEPEPDSMSRPEGEDEVASEAWSKAFQALREQCLDVTVGKLSLEKMPAPCRKALDQGRQVMRRVLAATHAEVGGLPAGAGSLSRPSFSREPSGMRALERVVELAALETRLLVAEGHAQEAVDVCLDSLAVSRELSLGGALHGSQLSASSQALTYRPCAEALDKASVERKRQALVQIGRLREGRPSFSAVLREESVFHQLTTFGPDFLPPEALSRLPPAGRTLVNAHSGWFFFTSRIGHPMLRRYLWRRNVSMFDAMAAAADLPQGERHQAFARIDAAHTLLSDFPNAVHALEYHRQWELLAPQDVQLAALMVLVEVDISRAERGAWPAPLTPPTAEGFSLQVLNEEEALLAPHDAKLAEYALPLAADSAP